MCLFDFLNDFFCFKLFFAESLPSPFSDSRLEFDEQDAAELASAQNPADTVRLEVEMTPGGLFAIFFFVG